MRSPDRVLVLSVVDGTKPKTATGMIDSRLFSGDNRLHAIKDVETCLWSMKYDSGLLPEPLKQQFTSFAVLKKHAEDYFKQRNVQIKEVVG